MLENAVEIENLKVRYSQFTLDVDYFNVPKGYVMGLVGRNGAGKTTLIKAMLSLIRRDQGKIMLLDKTMAEAETELKNRIGYVNDSFVYPDYYTAEKLMNRIGIFYHHFDETQFHELCRKFDIPWTTKFSNFSKGMKAKLSIVFAVSHRPELLILDEPTANLDPVSRREVLDLIYDYMQEDGRSVLFSTHITSDLDKIADYVTMIEHGRLLFSISKEKLQEDCQLFECEGEMPSVLRGCVL